MYLFNLFAGVILLITINELRHGSCQSFAFSVETVCGAGYTTQCTLTYDGTDYGWNNVDACSSKHQYVPHGSTGIQFVCKAALGETIFDLSNFEPLNTNWCFRVWGTTLDTSWEYDDCNSLGYTEMPTRQPTLMPTNPSMSPTNNPTIKPSAFPTNNPTNNPSLNPSLIPTLMPSSVPSMLPSIVPTYIPSNVPGLVPSNHPSQIPTYIPSNIPSNAPTAATNMPSYIPTAVTTMETIESETSNEQEHGTTSAHNSSYIENSDSDSSSQDSDGNNNQSLTFAETILSDIVYISIIVSVLLVCILICIYVFYWKKKIKYDSNKNSLSKVNILEMDGKELDKDGKATETRETYTVNIQITKGGSEKEDSGEKNDDVALNEEEGKGNGRNKRIDSDGSSLFEKPNQQDKINMQRLISLSQTKSTEGMQSVDVLVTPKGHTNGYLDDMDMEIDDNDNDKPKINVNSEDSESGEELYHNQVATPVSINSPSPDANDNDDHVADTPIDMLATPL